MSMLRRVCLIWMVPLAFGVAGCDCGGNNTGDADSGPDTDAGTDAGPMCMADADCGEMSLCCTMDGMCVDFTPGELCPGIDECAEGAASLDEMCELTCNECITPPLDPGLLATHLDMSVDVEANEVLLSGYSPGTPPSKYGDLVLGSWDPADMTVSWEIIDGAPDGPVEYAEDGWRGGVREPGPDVGKWTSIAKADDETLYISYYDVDNGDLKLAVRSGGSWTTHTVDSEGDAGRYSSLVLKDGVPVIAYLAITPPETDPGKPISKVRVATASGPMPTESDWTLTDAVSGEMPCRPRFCGDGQSCVEGNGLCVTSTGDCGGCGDDEVCNAGSCQTTLPDGYTEDMPPAIGLYIDLETTDGGLGLVYYDRASGNIRGVSYDGMMWGTPFLIDGYERDDPTVGDSGIGASLYVDGDGNWHVSYVDGAEENLRYAMVSGGTVMTREVVDDGSTDGTDPNPDGRHIVGDDSSIVVTPGGEIRIAYQDATVQRTMMATRMVTGGEWSVGIFDDMDHTGFWVEQVLDGSTSFVAQWWRNQTTDPPSNGTRVIIME